VEALDEPIQFAEVDLTRLETDAPAQRVDQRLRLLVDLLQQEMLVAALLRGDRVPGDPAGRPRVRSACEIGQQDRLPCHFGDLAVLEEYHVARVLEYRRNVRSDQVFLLTEADDDRGGGLCSAQA